MTRYEYRKLFWEKVDKRDLWEGVTQEYLWKKESNRKEKRKEKEVSWQAFFFEKEREKEIGKKGEGVLLVFSVFFIISEPIKATHVAIGSIAAKLI